MKTTSSRLDSKGRVIIPNALRDALGIKIGENILIEFDEANQRMILQPAKKHLKKMCFHISDSPGSLASVARILSKHAVDLLYTDSQSTRRRKEAVWNIIADFSRCNIKLLENDLKKEKAVKRFRLTNFG